MEAVEELFLGDDDRQQNSGSESGERAGKQPGQDRAHGAFNRFGLPCFATMSGVVATVLLRLDLDGFGLPRPP